MSYVLNVDKIFKPDIYSVINDSLDVSGSSVDPHFAALHVISVFVNSINQPTY